jgi:hypothetical protein
VLDATSQLGEGVSEAVGGLRRGKGEGKGEGKGRERTEVQTIGSPREAS